MLERALLQYFGCKPSDKNSPKLSVELTELYATQEVAYGAAITPPKVANSDKYLFLGWQDVPATMPAYDISIYGTMKSTSIAAIRAEGSSSQREVYTLSGIRLSSSGPLPRGVYIMDGKRVLVK